MLADKSLIEFNAALASASAVPGGGGASALVGALGMGLGIMVGSLTVGKKKYAAYEAELHALMEKAQALQSELIALIDEDAKAFEPLSRAYALPKDAENRAEVMEACLMQAASVPLEIVRLSCAAIELNARFAQIGSVLAVSDAGCGAALCRAALEAAALNVFVNTRLMADRAQASALDARVQAALDKYCPLADEAYSDVKRRLT